MSILLTPEEMGRRLRITGKTLRKWFREGQVPGYAVGGKVVRFDEREVLEAIRARRTGEGRRDG